jgi:hypothetical protein
MAAWRNTVNLQYTTGHVRGYFRPKDYINLYSYSNNGIVSMNMDMSNLHSGHSSLLENRKNPMWLHGKTL